MSESPLFFYPILFLMIPAAFLIGSIPFGIIFTRGSGVDPRTKGSRNIGATNVLRTAGKTPALLTLIGDIMKGASAVLLCRFAISTMDMSVYPTGFSLQVWELWQGIAGISVVLGHMFSVFLSFKGGKGVATGIGVLTVYSPTVAGITVLIWCAIAAVFRYSSLSAIIAVIALPFVYAMLGASSIKIIFGVTLSVLILIKHRSNINNLISGTETKI